MNIKLHVTDNQFIESLIPQKKPFVMVSELLYFDETSLKSGFVVTEENFFVENGFFQASGVLEHQAQSVALHTGYQFFLKKEKPPVGYIGAVKYFEIKFLPKIGDRIITEISILAEMMEVTMVKIISKIGNEMMAVSEMKTVIKQRL